MNQGISPLDLLKRDIIRKTHEVYEKGLTLFPQERKRLEVSFTLAGACAGQAHTRQTGDAHWIEYNLGLAWENQENFLNDTVPHEVAHIIANEFFVDLCPQGCGHENLWVFTAKKLGCNGKQYHQMRVTDTARKISTLVPADDI